MADILLINPRMYNNNMNENIVRYPPLGLLYLASYLKKSGYLVKILDLSILTNWNQKILEEAKNSEYKIIGISGTTPTHESIKKISMIFRKNHKERLIVSGGPHTSFVYEEILNTSDVDIVIKGEGELALKKIADFWIKGEGALKDIAGITYLDEIGHAHAIHGDNLITDLDKIPFPDWSLINFNYYSKKYFPVITSRGCPAKCIFCAAGAMANGKYRRRSNENIISELKILYYKYGINSYMFADNTFTACKREVIELCEKMRGLQFPIEWYCESRLDVLNQELVKQMVDSGCRGIQIGVETANENIQKIIRKKINIENIVEKISRVMQCGIESFFCTFVLGLPGETISSLEENFMLISQLRQLGVNIEVTLATPFPGTYLYEHADELGVEIKHKKWKNYFFNEITLLPEGLDEKTLRNYFVEATKLCIEEKR